MILRMAILILTVSSSALILIPDTENCPQLLPPNYLAFILDVFFTSSFCGHFFVGKSAKFTSVADVTTSPFAKWVVVDISKMVAWVSTVGLNGFCDMYKQLFRYMSVYVVFGVITMAIVLIAILVSPWIVKMMGGAIILLLN